MVKKPQLKLRQLAVECWHVAGSPGPIDVRMRELNAARLFRKRAGNKAVAKPVSFVRLWAGRFEAEGHVLDRPKPGAPKQVSEEEAKRAVQLLWAGYVDSDGNQQYSSTTPACGMPWRPVMSWRRCGSHVAVGWVWQRPRCCGTCERWSQSCGLGGKSGGGNSQQPTRRSGWSLRSGWPSGRLAG